MRAAIVPEPGAGFEIVEREKPTPATDEVRVEVEACGVCHSHQLVVGGQHPAVEYPRVPGHEIAGRVDAVDVGACTRPESRRPAPPTRW